jgi:hypothetical protein
MGTKSPTSNLPSRYLELRQNEETNQLQPIEAKLNIPKWGIEFLQRRADLLNQGDLNAVLNEVFNAGLSAFIELSTIDDTPVNLLPC